MIKEFPLAHGNLLELDRWQIRKSSDTDLPTAIEHTQYIMKVYNYNYNIGGNYKTRSALTPAPTTDSLTDSSLDTKTSRPEHDIINRRSNDTRTYILLVSVEFTLSADAMLRSHRTPARVSNIITGDGATGPSR